VRGSICQKTEFVPVMVAWPSERKFAMATAEITRERGGTAGCQAGCAGFESASCNAGPVSGHASGERVGAESRRAFRGAGSGIADETGRYDGKAEPELLGGMGRNLPHAVQDFIRFRACLPSVLRGGRSSDVERSRFA
jgi:hypothetical protein